MNERRAPQLSLVGLLAGSALGVYLLVVSGATAAVANAAVACGTWPTCHGSLADPALLVAVAHRVTVAMVGILLAGTALALYRRSATRRVRWAVWLAAILYPLQVGIGAFAALNGGPTILANAHLAIGMAIFGCMSLALAWQLAAETVDAEEPLGETDRPTASSAPSGPTDRSDDGLATTLWAYVQLTKPRLMWLLCLVALAGMALAAGPTLQLRTVVLTLGGGVLAIGASGTFNHVLERDVDRRMNRTNDRPLATDRVGVSNAVLFGLALSTVSVVALLQVNVLAAALGLTAIVFYSVVYTLVLKPHTVQNTVIGGFAGALPALIGWAAVTGELGWPALVLAAVVFLWTPAHFYNLAMAYRDDYARGDFPMLPVVRGPAVARLHVLLYLVATMGAAAALVVVAPLGPVYAGTVVVLAALFLWAVIRLHRQRTETAAMRTFHASNTYLGGLLLIVIVDAMVI